MRWKLGLCVLLTSVFVGAAMAAEEATVQIGHNKLEPSELTIAAGTTVIFHNQDQMPGGHTIVADDGSFESPGLAKDESWSHTFADPGDYGYSIKEHPAAKGRVIVE